VNILAFFYQGLVGSCRIFSSRPSLKFLRCLRMKRVMNQDLEEVLVIRSCGDPGEILQEVRA